MEPTPDSDISSVVLTGFGNIIPELLPVAAAGLGVTALIWGIPKAVGFFKKTAK